MEVRASAEHGHDRDGIESRRRHALHENARAAGALRSVTSGRLRIAAAPPAALLAGRLSLLAKHRAKSERMARLPSHALRPGAWRCVGGAREILGVAPNC